MTDEPPPAAEETLQDLYDHAPVGLVSTTVDDVVIRVNAAFLAATGYEARDILGGRFQDLLDPGGQLFYETRSIPTLRLDGVAREVFLSIRRADGTMLPAIVTSVLVPADGDRPDIIRMAVMSAAGRREYEQSLLADRRAAEASEARVRILQNASASFAASATEHELAEALADIVREALDAAAVCVALRDDDGDLRVAGGRNPLDGMVPLGAPWPVSRTPTVDEPLTVSRGVEGADHPDIVAALGDARLESLTVFPLRRDGAELGIAVAFLGRRRSIDDGPRELVTAICRQASQVLARMRMQRELERVALHDPLTGLPNRANVRQAIGLALAASRRDGRPLTLMFIDLDGFKSVNDVLGHNAGDDLLKQVAGRLRSVVREADSLGRIGGDEFLVLCANTEEDVAAAIADRIRSVVEQPVAGFPATLSVTASIGVAVHRPGPAARVSTDEFVAVADAAMYQAKGSGRNRVEIVHC